MTRVIELGTLDGVVDRLVESGRFASDSDVLREGVKLVEARERRRAVLVDALERGLAEAEADDVVDAEDLFADLRARYGAQIPRP